MSENKFTYSYDAPTERERREIEDIRKQYAPPRKDDKQGKMERLRALDKKVKNPPLIAAVCLGVVGVLLFGFGLTLTLEWNEFVWGIVCMALGCIPLACAHPVRLLCLKRNKQKYGDEIVALSEELLHKQQD